MITTYKLRAEAALFETPVESPTHRYPPAIDLHATDKRGSAPDVYIRFVLRGTDPLRPEVVEFRLTARDGGRSIRPSDQTDWPLPLMARNLFARFAQSLDDDPQALPHGPIGVAEVREVHGDLADAFSKRRDPAQSELELVAQIYRDNIDHKPVEMVQKEMTYGSRGTAARRVQQARQAGLLPPTSKGKKQG